MRLKPCYYLTVLVLLIVGTLSLAQQPSLTRSSNLRQEPTNPPESGHCVTRKRGYDNSDIYGHEISTSSHWRPCLATQKSTWSCATHTRRTIIDEGDGEIGTVRSSSAD
jgi:hypothetical protein